MIKGFWHRPFPRYVCHEQEMKCQTEAFDLSYPERRLSSVVFASPHSGHAYPSEFLQASVLDAQTIRSSEDAFVDDLFSAAPEFGAPLLKARRAAVVR